LVSKAIPKQSRKDLAKTLKLLNSIKKLDSKKSSRQGFVCLLNNIRYILGEEVLKKTYFNYKKMDPYSELEFKNQNAKECFERMRSSYSLAWKYFLKSEHKLAACVKFTYITSSKFKQKTYMRNGIKSAISHKKQLKRLIKKAKKTKQIKK
jgi:hypothetical protein